jgi:hypothetical protein
LGGASTGFSSFLSFSTYAPAATAAATRSRPKALMPFLPSSD